MKLRRQRATGICVSCAKSIENRMPTALYCWDCSAVRVSAHVTISCAVRKAVARGDLLPATAHACVDCGDPAVEYDHRDYNQPLAVEPVCRSCNIRRGPAAVFNQPQAA